MFKQMCFFSGTKLAFTDTDSFMYRITYEGNIYKRLKELDADEEWFDFSNYSCDHPNFSRRNHLVPGNWKKIFNIIIIIIIF